MTTMQRILVLGAGGFVGMPMTKSLIASGHYVRAVSHRALQMGAAQEILSLDLTAATDWASLLDGMEAVFVSLPIGPDEAALGARIADAISRSKVSHIVHLGVINPVSHHGIPHFASKTPIQAAFADTGRKLTMLACNHFFQNDIRFLPAMTGAAGPPVYPLPYGQRGVHAIDARDIADAATNAFNYPDRFIGWHALAGEECITVEYAASLYADVLQMPVSTLPDIAAWDEFWRTCAPAASDWLTNDMRHMWKCTTQLGCLASSHDIAQSRAIVGKPLRQYNDFVCELLAKGRAMHVGH